MLTVSFEGVRLCVFGGGLFCFIEKRDERFRFGEKVDCIDLPSQNVLLLSRIVMEMPKAHETITRYRSVPLLVYLSLSGVRRQGDVSLTCSFPRNHRNRGCIIFLVEIHPSQTVLVFCSFQKTIESLYGVFLWSLRRSSERKRKLSRVLEQTGAQSGVEQRWIERK